MKRSDIMRLPAPEREGKLAEIRLELMKLRAQASTGTAQKGSGRIKALRKTIARLLTASGRTGSK